MTHTRTIRDYVQQAAVMNLSQLAESDARREEAQLRVRHHAALIAGIVAASEYENNTHKAEQAL